MDTPTQIVLCFQLYYRSQKWHSLISLEIEMVDHRPIWMASMGSCVMAVSMVASSTINICIWAIPWNVGNVVPFPRNAHGDDPIPI